MCTLFCEFMPIPGQAVSPAGMPGSQTLLKYAPAGGNSTQRGENSGRSHKYPFPRARSKSPFDVCADFISLKAAPSDSRPEMSCHGDTQARSILPALSARLTPWPVTRRKSPAFLNEVPVQSCDCPQRLSGTAQSEAALFNRRLGQRTGALSCSRQPLAASTNLRLLSPLPFQETATLKFR